MKVKNIFIYHLDYELQKLFALERTYPRKTIYSCFNAVTRIAYLLCEESILIPASNYFESDLAFSIINKLRALNELGTIKLISSSHNLNELLNKKTVQHGDNVEGLRYHYKDFLDSSKKIYLPGTLIKRQGSASNDIRNAWLYSVGSEELLMKIFKMMPKNINVSSFEDKLYQVPQRLGERAYISEYILPLLEIDKQYYNSVDNLLNVFITREYIESFLKEYDAVCLKDIPLIDTNLILIENPELGKQHISYKYYAEQLQLVQYKNVQASKFVESCKAEELFEFKNSSIWKQIVEPKLSDDFYLKNFMKDGNDNMNVDDIKIGIITALPKECVAIKVMMDNIQECFFKANGAGHRFYIGEIKSANNKIHKVALGLCGMGNNKASIRATNMLSHFPNIESIIMTGIAGGIPSPQNKDTHVRLGDIVVSNGIVQYDFTKETVDGISCRSEPPVPGAQLLEAVNMLKINEYENKFIWREYIDKYSKTLNFTRPKNEMDILHDEDGNIICHPIDDKRGEYPRVIHSKIASANNLLKNSKTRDSLKKQYGVSAVEMEASGIADAVWSNNSGYIVVRGICDYCDNFKNDIWQEYAALVAAAYTRALIESLPAF